MKWKQALDILEQLAYQSLDMELFTDINFKLITKYCQG